MSPTDEQAWNTRNLRMAHTDPNLVDWLRFKSVFGIQSPYHSVLPFLLFCALHAVVGRGLVPRLVHRVQRTC